VPSTYVRTAPDRFDAAYILRVVRVVSGAEYTVKYADSALGYVWSVAKPLSWFCVLYVVFGRFFQLNGGFEHYTVYLLIGLVMWTYFVDATSLALGSFVLNAAVLRRISLPRAVIPISATITTALTLVVNIGAVGVFLAVERISPRVEWLLVPVAIIELVVFSVGVALFLATAYVRARDAGPLWDLAVQLLFFASPIIYPVGFLPTWAQKIAFADPFVQAMQDFRAAIFPEKEAMTAADVYGSNWGYAIPLGALAATLALATWLYRREAPYLAERA
jgi:ABC-2 type transport system permease protein